MTKMKWAGRVIAGVVTGILAVFLSWVLSAESSPFYNFFLINKTVPNLWMLLNFPVFMAYILTGAQSVAFGVIVCFLQWFLVGFVFALTFSILRQKLRSPRMQ